MYSIVRLAACRQPVSVEDTLGGIATLFRSISYNAENFRLWGATKASKYNSALYGILFVMIPDQLIELQNVSLFTEHNRY